MTPKLLSGGADGADYFFGRCAKKKGHIVFHYSFQGHRVKHGDTEDFVVLTEEELKEADGHLKLANKTLQRKFPTRSGYINNLLRRNYWQIRDTEAVYAVAPLENGKVDGGTAWAVQMAINNGKDVFLFDTHGVTCTWFQWDFWSKIWRECKLKEQSVNFPQKRYTGIGSRKLPLAGERAILSLYGLDSID